MAQTNRSRINKQIQEQTKRTIIVSAGGSILLILGLFFIGPHLITGMSVFIQNAKDTAPGAKTDATIFVTAPILDPLPISTNSARIVVSGIAQKERKVKLYVNDTRIGEEETESDGTFEFGSVRLEDGSNDIRAISYAGEKESTPSRSQTVKYMSKAPSLSVDSPSDNQEIKGDRRLVISGKTDEGAQVSVNDFLVLTDSEGKFSYTMQVPDGETVIKITATDDAGNKTEMQKKITYSP